MAVREGTKAIKNTEPDKDARQVRCASCKGLTIKQPNGMGGLKNHCPRCNIDISFVKI